MIRTELKRTIPTAERKIRMKKCAAAGCRQPFQPRNSLQTCCSVPCAIDYTTAEKAAKERRERQEGLRKLKRKADHIAEAQTAFNAYCRERDKGQQCISCDVHLASLAGIHGGGIDCGHYRSRGSAPHLRFDERNAHGQCKKCNRYKSGNVTEYRWRLIARIGLAAVEALEADNEPRRWTVEELIEIKTHYRAKLKALKEAA